MSAAHTPGPWVRDTKSGINCDVRATSGRKVALCWGLTTLNPHRPAYRAECDANAHLIAAAPDLLAELQNIANADTSKWDNPSDFKAWAQSRARAAIAKVTGAAA